MTIGTPKAVAAGTGGAQREIRNRFSQIATATPNPRAVSGFNERYMQPITEELEKAFIEYPELQVSESGFASGFGPVLIPIVPGNIIKPFDLINISPLGARLANSGVAAPLHATDVAMTVSGGFVTPASVPDVTMRFASGETVTGVNTQLVVYLSRTPGRASLRFAGDPATDPDYATWGFTQMLGFQRGVINGSTLLGTVGFRPEQRIGA